MFLAWKEIKHSKLRYMLIGFIIMLIAWLVFLLSGLAMGLSTANGASINNMKSDYMIFQKDSRYSMLRSLVPLSTMDEAKNMEGVKDAAPLGQLTLTLQKQGSDEQIDATVLATDPGSFLVPRITEGVSFSSSGNEIVLDDAFKDHGIKLGDQIKVKQTSYEFNVVGFVKGESYNHMPVGFMDIAHWQQLKFPTPESKSGIENPVSIVAVQMASNGDPDVLNSIPDSEVATNHTALQNLPGYSAELMSVNMMLLFLFVIAVFVLAAFFYVITLQKSNQFGVLKAIGATTWFLARSLIIQVAILSIIGIAIGLALAYGVAAIMPPAVPFTLDNTTVISYAFTLLIVTLLGTVLSLHKIAKVDALEAIGRAD